jgi:hypothetical protein
MNAVLIGSASAIALAARYGRRGRGLSGDIFNILQTREQPSLLGPKPVRHDPPRHGSSFTCQQFRDKLLRISLEIEAGVREPPSRKELQIEVGRELGVKWGSIAAVILGRCASERPLYERVSRKGRVGFTREESAGSRARLAKARTTFECDDLEEVIRSTEDKRAKTLAKLLSARLGVTIPTARVQNALKPKSRCKHLRELLPNPKRGRGYTSFTCEEMEKHIMRYRGTKGVQRRISEALGVSNQTVSLVLKGRCKHLSELLAG